MLLLLGVIAALAHADEIREAPDSVCSIDYHETKTSGAYCSGTLIAPNIVVTAAHCFGDGKSGSTANVTVGCGINSQSDKGESFHFDENFTAREIDGNSDWHHQGSDFAFIRLDHAARIVTTMALPESLQSFQSEFMTPSATSAGDFELKPSIECRWSGFGVEGSKHNRYFRTSDQSPKNGLKGFQSGAAERASALVINHWGAEMNDLRHGDSGGPLYCRKDAASSWKLIAVVNAKEETMNGKNTGSFFYSATASPEFMSYWSQVRAKWQ